VNYYLNTHIRCKICVSVLTLKLHAVHDAALLLNTVIHTEVKNISVTNR